MKPELPAARHAIDLLSMIAEKTRGNLALDEQRLIENALTELRFRFVQVSEQKPLEKRPAPDASRGPDAGTPSHHGARLGHQFGSPHHRLRLRRLRLDRSAR